MSPALRAAAVLVALLSCAAGRAHAAPQDVTAGMLRTPTSKNGSPLRAEAKMSSDSLGHIAHGTTLTVEAVEGAWLRVSTEVSQADGTKSRKTGWIKAADTVQPYVLTGGGRPTGGGGLPESRSVAAAGRGFDKNIEGALAQKDSAIRANLVNVDRMEEAKPSPSEVSTFAKEGRLGFPGRTR